MTWSDAMQETLKVLWHDGLSASQAASEIAKRYEVPLSRSAVIGKVHRMGLSARRQAYPRRPKPIFLRPLPAPKPAPEPAPELATPDPAPGPIQVESLKPVTFMRLGDQHCRFPLGDPQTPEFRFCGNQPAPLMPYCLGHCRMTYQPAREWEHA